jgi:nucleoside-diphosphate-sugar epimerase
LNGQRGEAYNVGSDDERSIYDIARTGKALWPQLTIGAEPSHPVTVDAPNRRRPDLNKVMSLLAHPPLVELVFGLERTYRYYSGK